MMRATSVAQSLFLLIPFSLVTGCGPKAAPVAEVSGVVIMDGKPLSRISIQFLPDPEKGTFGPITAGTTDENGHFELTCIDKRRGAAVGWNRVVLNDLMPRTQKPLRISREKEDDPETEAKLAKTGGRVASSSRVPDKYTASGRTPLILEVKPEKQEITIEVKR